MNSISTHWPTKRLGLADIGCNVQHFLGGQ